MNRSHFITILLTAGFSAVGLAATPSPSPVSAGGQAAAATVSAPSVQVPLDSIQRKVAASQRERARVVPPPSFQPCEPESEPVTESSRLWGSYENVNVGVPSDTPSLDFCAEWNPEFAFNGHHCCRNFESIHHRKARMSCFSRRPRGSFCEEMTDDQKEYISNVQSGRIPDVLQTIAQDMVAHREQSYCTGNNGFLAYGRPVVPTAKNRLAIRSPGRCTEFGNDNMVGMVEWLGEKVGEAFPASAAPGVRLVLGDISGPRGGCLSGMNSIVGHRSHTNGTDADIGFLAVRGGGRLPSPVEFHYDFDPNLQWWLIKQAFHNPYACIKVIFLDRRLIRKLAKAARNDDEWSRLGRFLRHMPGHKNHMHVRIGAAPGRPGCSLDPHPELEPDGEDEGGGQNPDVDLVDLGITPVEHVSGR
ncbi:MAG: penicillin-insensitive murein endopeptidase [Oligoflexia bacterium]|nr:penicillin-insensitive murein endopeptidase [Oligoflexia bacterium]